MYWVKDFSIIIMRIVTIFPLVLFIALYMGKRAIGELPVFDFLVIISLGSVVGADIAEPDIPHIHTAVAIILIGFFQKLVSKSAIKYRKLGRMITFEPTVVIQDGKFIAHNLKRHSYSIDNVLQMMREQEIFDINDIHLGIIEANGKLSVLKRDSKALVTIEDVDLKKKAASLSYPIIIDGKVYEKVLAKLKLSDDWLKQELLKLNVSNEKEVFFASVNTNRELHISLKSYMENQDDILPMYH